MKQRATTLLGLLLAFLIVAPLSELVSQTVVINAVSVTPKKRVKPTTSATDSTYWATIGLRNVARFQPVYLAADTTGSGTSTATSFTWTLTPPASSGAVLYDGMSPTTAATTSSMSVNFVTDSAGYYYVTVAVAPSGTLHTDTIYVESYAGVSNTYPGCGTCHNSSPSYTYNNWSTSNHATIYTRALMGQIEAAGVPGAVNGVYKESSCAKCHTTGYDVSANNGNYGYEAKKAGWDTLWHYGYPESAGEDIIPYGDSTAVKLMATSFPWLKSKATIGCESCHGPMADHPTDATNKYKRGKSMSSGVCNYCHDSSSKHGIGGQHATSLHAVGTSFSHATQTSCFPCHSGTALIKFVQNGSDTTGLYNQWSTAADGGMNITCAVCHDPHGNSNPAQIRTVNAPAKLRNGYTLPAPTSGMSAGRLCVNCHNTRYSVTQRVTTTAPYYGFTDRYGPHYSNQADIFFGTGGYQYGDTTLTGITTHAGLANECVTCHMAVTSSGTAGHYFSMVDTTGGVTTDRVDACKQCHGSNITSFADIKAYIDYDRNGKIEDVQTEVKGLLALVKSKVPKNATTGEPVSMRSDSLLVKGNARAIQDIWNYYFIMNDKSYGIHNTKYTVALLQKTMGWTMTDVKATTQRVPTTFELGQNYPNPFNPSTTINFALPKQEHVVLSVYDMVGHEVNRLVDNEMSAGTYKATWHGDTKSGAKVSSGIYFYRIQAGSFTSVKKMVMLK